MSDDVDARDGIDPTVAPSGAGCAEATVLGPALAGPTSPPDDQPAPGPRGRVPEDWLDHIHR